jgi:hypothetical protein
MFLEKAVNEREYEINGYYCRISKESLGFSYGEEFPSTRRELLNVADPSNFEYWINYESKLV